MDNKISALIGVVIGLLIGLGAAMAMNVEAEENDAFSTTQEASESNRKSNESSESKKSSVSVREDRPRREARRDETPAARKTDSSSSRELPREVRESLRKVSEQVAALPAGDQEIRGRVVDGSGSPVSNAEVRARLNAVSQPQMTRKGSPKRQDLPPDWEIDPYAGVQESMERRARNNAISRANTLRAFTNEEGYYVIGGLGDVTASLTAYHEGYIITVQQGVNAYTAPGTTVNFVAQKISSVEFDVQMPDGTQAEFATIKFGSGANNSYNYRGYYPSSRSSSNQQSWNREERRIPLAPGQYEVHAEIISETGTLSSEKLSLNVEEGIDPGLQVLKLQSRPSLAGLIYMPEYQSNANLNVRYRELDDDESTEGLLDKPINNTGWTSVNANPGNPRRFFVTDIEPGRYVFGAGFGWQYFEVIQEVDVQVGPNEVSMTLPEPDRNKYVEVSVKSPDGTPLDDATFSVVASSPRNWGSSQNITIRRSEGVYWVSLPVKHQYNTQANDNVEKQITVTVTNRKYGTSSQSVDVSDSTSVELTFDEPARLAVNIAGYDKETCPQLSVSVVPEGSGNNQNNMYGGFNGGYRNNTRAKTRNVLSNGELLIIGLVPGEYALKLQTRTSYGGLMTIHEESLTLASGENSAALAVPAFYQLEVRIDEQGSQTIVYVRPIAEENSWMTANIDDKGSAYFRELSAGSYVVNYNGKQMPVNVSGNTSVTLEKQEYNAMQVRIRDGSKAMAQAGFKNGDRIVAIDGARITNYNDAYNEIRKRREGLANFTILRGSESLLISCDIKFLLNRNEGGGSLNRAFQ